MNKKDKEIAEVEEEEVILDHWSHEHPLTLIQTSLGDRCNGCLCVITSGEEAYGCSKRCLSSVIGETPHVILFHQECAEMPRMIRHPMHPHHILMQQIGMYYDLDCAICEGDMWKTAYSCTSSKCKFQIHMRCAHDNSVMDAEDDEQSRMIQHPSHPHHQLRLLRARGSATVRCDACGTTRKGNSYLCTVCQYWIHQKCASLPATIEREDHHHTLSLSFRVPPEYLKFYYTCDVCRQDSMPNYWVYHCRLCRYFVHIKCAFKKSPHATSLITKNAKASDGKEIILFPINDVAEELIRAFVVGGGGAIAAIRPDDEEIINAKYKFHSHKHQLSLILISSSSPSSHDDETKEDEDEDEDDCGKYPELICDGCTTPIIFQKKQGESSSKMYDCYYYISCSECKYYLHWECFHLPPQLPSLPLHHIPDHNLILQSCTKRKFKKYCSICKLYTNGLVYGCTKCSFQADIKCASLPDTIHHAAHPEHLLKHLNKEDVRLHYSWLSCAAACDGYFPGDSDCYVCDICDFIIDAPCAMRPASVTDRTWDKRHELLLTYDANLNHPDEFYCDDCEREMNPKMWMYHCRPCDLSFHPDCFPAASGEYRNIKLGREYVVARAHPHPLTHQLPTTKRRCHNCRQKQYDIGFLCAPCNFFICSDCGDRMWRRRRMRLVD